MSEAQYEAGWTDRNGNPPPQVPSVEDIERQYLGDDRRLTALTRSRITRKHKTAVAKVAKIDQAIAKVLKAQSRPNCPNFNGLMREETRLKEQRADAIGVFENKAWDVMNDRHRLFKASRKAKPSVSETLQAKRQPRTTIDQGVAEQPRRRAFKPRQQQHDNVLSLER